MSPELLFGAIGALASMATIGGLLGGWIFRLSGRLQLADTKADSAALSAERAGLTTQALRVALDQVERDLQEHRVQVAKEYVSNETIKGLEEKLIRAVDRLGDRLDALLNARANPISG